MTGSGQRRVVRVLAVDADLPIRWLYGKALSDLPLDPATVDDAADDPCAPEVGPGAAHLQLKACSDGAEAVDCVRQAVQERAPFAVVFLALRQPQGPDGLDTAQRIRALDPHTNLVIVTGQADLDPEHLAAQVTPRDKLLYMEKPFNRRQVRHFALALATKWEAERRLRGEHARLESLVTQRTQALARANELLVEDIAVRTRAEAALLASEERYALVTRAANDGLWDWDLDRGRVFYSERWRALLGLRPSDALDTPELWLQRVHPEDVDALRQRIERYVGDGEGRFEHEHRLRHAKGHYLWVLCRGLGVRDAQGRVLRFAGSISDVSARRRAEDRLVHDALHDVLTDLPNRLLFIERLRGTIAKARRRPDHEYAVVFMDLDRFKTVNDSLGHPIGDQLLQAVAQRLASLLRDADVLSRQGDNELARFGGDEFTILLEDVGGPENMIRVARRLLDGLQRPFTLCGRDVFTNASMGIVLGAPHYEDPGQLLRDADIAMYRAKALGGATAVIFDVAMHAQAVARMELETELQRAVPRDEMRAWYQPIVDLPSGQLAGFEALLRWQHPSRGLLGAGTFIPLCEETGLIVELGDWVLRQACTDIKELQRSHGRPLYVSVNVSGRQLAQTRFADDVLGVLAGAALAPSSLKLEVTERAVMDDILSVRDTLEHINAAGVALHMDDFGTGYSALSYLHRYPFHTLKIDRSFLADSEHNPRGREVIRAIVELSHNLGLTVTAEGVETKGQAHWLGVLGCDHAQGYLFARPMPLAQALELPRRGEEEPLGPLARPHGRSRAAGLSALPGG